MKRIVLKDRASLEAVAQTMKNKEPFIIITDDENFNPLGYDRYSADIWLGAAGGGALMAIGAGAIYLAFIDPEPTSKLGLLVGGGVALALTGGGVIITVLVTRSKYSATMRFNQKTKKYEWTLAPK
jgi:hypothetical protein